MPPRGTTQRRPRPRVVRVSIGATNLLTQSETTIPCLRQTRCWRSAVRNRPPTSERPLLFRRAYRTRCSGLTGMRTHVTDGNEARDPGAKALPPSGDERSLAGKSFSVHADGAVEASRCYLRRSHSLNRSSLEGASHVSQTVLPEHAIGSGNCARAWRVQRCARRRQQHESVYRRFVQVLQWWSHFGAGGTIQRGRLQQRARGFIVAPEPPERSDRT